MTMENIGAAIKGEVEIEAPPESVFEALTNPAEMAEWWGSADTYRTKNWKVDLRVGGGWSCDAESPRGVSKVNGTYLEIDPPRKLAYTWNPSWQTGPETRVEFRLEKIASGTRLRLLHSGFEGQEESQKGHSEGWQRVLGWLNKHLAAAKAQSSI
jgi:uncharacterized protein YndB with AHSA1/START domain